MGFLSSIGNIFKKILPIAATVAPFIPGIGPIVGAGLGALSSVVGKSEQNKGNIQAAQTQMDFQAQSTEKQMEHQNISTAQQMEHQTSERKHAQYFSQQSADKQMDFQREANAKAMAFTYDREKSQQNYAERLSSSAHQREIKDLKKAGLNPILSAKYGGSSSPSMSPNIGQTSSGAHATSSGTAGASSAGASSAGSKANIVDSLTPAISTALQMKTVEANVGNTLAQRKVIKANEENVRANTNLTILRGQTEIQNYDKAQAEVILKQLQGKSEFQRIQILKQTLKISTKTAQVLAAKLPGIQLQETVDTSPIGILGKYLRALNPLTSSAKDLSNIGAK